MTSILRAPARRLSLLLVLVSAHSAAVGVGLIAQPPALLARMGYAPVGDPFFPVQGGVFHIVMAVGYAMAAADLDRNRCLAFFSVVVKVAATVFLVGYWLLIRRIDVVLMSGIVDGLMALALGLGYAAWRRTAEGVRT